MSTPLVSVCIPTYNRAALLRQSIQSVLGQSLRDFELIISDNASTDETPEVVRTFADDRIRYLRHPVNIGASRNFNQGFEKARGPYVTVFHDDDLMLADNLRLKTAALEQHPRVGLVHSRFDLIDETGAVVRAGTAFGAAWPDADCIEAGHSFLRRSLLGRNTVNPPSVMLRRECYQRVGGFNEQLRFTTDFELWMRIARHYDVMFLATPLLQYRQHAGWGSSEFLTVVGGLTRTNVRGVEEEYAAKRFALEGCRGVLAGWRELRRAVRRRTGQEVAGLIEEQLQAPADWRPARLALAATCRRFPELLLQRPVLKLWIKLSLGDRLCHMLKRAYGSR
jgi:hypothetical protein